MAITDFPSVNGVVYSGTSAALRCNGILQPFLNITYDDELKPGDVMVAGKARKHARTTGQGATSASMEMLRADGLRLIADLKTINKFFKKAEFPIQVEYGEEDQESQTDDLERVRVTKTGTGVTNDGKEATLKFDLNVMRIKWNGSYAY